MYNTWLCTSASLANAFWFSQSIKDHFYQAMTMHKVSATPFHFSSIFK